MRAQQAVARRVQLMLPCMYKYTPGEEMAVRSCTKKKKGTMNFQFSNRKRHSGISGNTMHISLCAI